MAAKFIVPPETTAGVERLFSLASDLSPPFLSHPFSLLHATPNALEDSDSTAYSDGRRSLTAENLVAHVWCANL